MSTERIRQWRVVAALASLTLVVAACTADDTSSAGASGDAGGEVVMLSSQLSPTEEAELMRTEILAGFSGEVEFIGAEPGPFNDQVNTQADTGEGDISLIGGLDGEFQAFAEAGALTDLSDVAEELADLGINEEYLELGKVGGDQQLYIPWMQAAYTMAARSEAMPFLPEGADINALTWEQLTEWGANIEAETGERKLGFPAGEDGLFHRFFQGYAYPAFTGGVNTTFSGDAALEMWSWLTDTWQYVNPQSTTYGFMQEPLQSGEVWVAWDHTARLVDAFDNMPEDVVGFPVPAGPEGRAYMPVVAGLAIPTGAPNVEGAKELIKHLLAPETQAATLQAVSFFPVIEGELPEVGAGVQSEIDAVNATINAADAVRASLPAGLGEEGGAYSQVFRDAFSQIVIEGQDAAGVLEGLLPDLQAIFDSTEAPCWPPDPASDGPCQAQ
jgi:multiple sugar transport system substrate-binding protein